MSYKKILVYLSPERFTSIGYQSIFIALSACSIYYFMYVPFSDFLPLEIHTQILPVTPEVIQNWGTQPTRVQTGLVVTHVLKFDIGKDEFTFTVLMWFDFDEKKISKETIDKFSFIKGTIAEKSVFYEKRGPLTRAYYYVTLSFSETLNYQRFPLDDHFLYVRLTNEAVTPDQVIFQADPQNFLFLKKINIPAWELTELSLESGYRIWPLDAHNAKNTIEESVVNFGLGFSKSDLRYIALIIFPMVLLFYIGLLSFAIQGKNTQDVLIISAETSLASITGLIAYYFVIQSVSPAVGHFMITDYLLFFIFFSSLFAFLINGLSVQHIVFVSAKTVAKLKGITVICLHIAFITLWYYLSNIYLLR